MATYYCNGAFLVAQTVKNLSAMWETQVRSLGWEDPLEKEMATHPSILLGESHGQRSLVGYSPCSHKELDMTEQLTLLLQWAFLQISLCTRPWLLFRKKILRCGISGSRLLMHIFQIPFLKVSTFSNKYPPSAYYVPGTILRTSSWWWYAVGTTIIIPFHRRGSWGSSSCRIIELVRARAGFGLLALNSCTTNAASPAFWAVEYEVVIFLYCCPQWRNIYLLKGIVTIQKYYLCWEINPSIRERLSEIPHFDQGRS